MPYKCREKQLAAKREGSKRYQAKHAARIKDYKAKHYRRNRGAYQEKAWRGRAKRVYGITLEQYEEALKMQNGRCALCRALPKKRRLSIDHCHKTGQLRGLLCLRCNTALERVENVVLWADAAIFYLKCHGSWGA